MLVWSAPLSMNGVSSRSVEHAVEVVVVLEWLRVVVDHRTADLGHLELVVHATVDLERAE